jgi:large subunit ribosomal protein L13
MRHVIDAQGQILGRLSSQVAHILQGKMGVDYNPRLPGRDIVLIKNASKIKISGKKYTDKIYEHHTGYIGHLKKRSFSKIFERDPAEVLELAISRMLPKNKLRKERMKRLIIEK